MPGASALTFQSSRLIGFRVSNFEESFCQNSRERCRAGDLCAGGGVGCRAQVVHLTLDPGYSHAQKMFFLQS